MKWRVKKEKKEGYQQIYAIEKQQWFKTILTIYGLKRLDISKMSMSLKRQHHNKTTTW